MTALRLDTVPTLPLRKVLLTSDLLLPFIIIPSNRLVDVYSSSDFLRNVFLYRILYLLEHYQSIMKLL